MRLVGLLLMILGGFVVYEMAYKGLTVPAALKDVGLRFGLPQVAGAAAPGGGSVPAGPPDGGGLATA